MHTCRRDELASLIQVCLQRSATKQHMAIIFIVYRMIRPSCEHVHQCLFTNPSSQHLPTPHAHFVCSTSESAVHSSTCVTPSHCAWTENWCRTKIVLSLTAMLTCSQLLFCQRRVCHCVAAPPVIVIHHIHACFQVSSHAWHHP
jgi:hypothetical protein